MVVTLEDLLLGVGLSSAFVVGVMTTRTTPKCDAIQVPILTLVCFSIIAAFSFTQLLVAPHLLPLLMRQAGLVSAGEPWRLLTSVLVQDGGWVGAAFNLIALLTLGTVAERILERRRWTVTAIVSVMTAGSFALSWQPTGAGNSILNCGLAGGICAVSFIKRRSGQTGAPTMAASLCFVLLLLRRDIHGVAAVAGALMATLCGQWQIQAST